MIQKSNIFPRFIQTKGSYQSTELITESHLGFMFRFSKESISVTCEAEHLLK